MNTKGIKFLAVLAVLAMAFAVFAVVADSESSDAVTVDAEDFFVPGEDDPATEVKTGSTVSIKLLKDVEITEDTISLPAVINGTEYTKFTLDLNNHKLTSDITVGATSTLTVTGTGTLSGDINANGAVTIDKAVTIEYLNVSSTATEVIVKGTTDDVIITGGESTEVTIDTTAKVYDIETSGATVTVKGTLKYGLYATSGTVFVKSGANIGGDVDVYGTATVNLQGGNIDGVIYKDADTATLKITGGVYKDYSVLRYTDSGSIGASVVAGGMTINGSEAVTVDDTFVVNGTLTIPGTSKATVFIVPEGLTFTNLAINAADKKIVVIFDGEYTIADAALKYNNGAVALNLGDSTITAGSITSGTATTASAKLAELEGTFTFYQGSIAVDVDSASGTIELADGQELKLSGYVGNLEIKLIEGAKSAKVIVEADAEVRIGGGLTIADKIAVNVYGKVIGNGSFYAKSIEAFDGAVIKNVTVSATSAVAWSGSDINFAKLTPEQWTGKDANGGTWTVNDRGELTLNNYKGTYNFNAYFYNDGSKTAVSGDVVVSHTPVVSTEDMMAGQFISTYFYGEIATVQDSGSLTLNVDISNLSFAMFTGIQATEIDTVDITVDISGTPASEGDMPSMLMITGLAVSEEIFNANIDVDVLSDEGIGMGIGATINGEMTSCGNVSIKGSMMGVAISGEVKETKITAEGKMIDAQFSGTLASNSSLTAKTAMIADINIAQGSSIIVENLVLGTPGTAEPVIITNDGTIKTSGKSIIWSNATIKNCAVFENSGELGVFGAIENLPGAIDGTAGKITNTGNIYFHTYVPNMMNEPVSVYVDDEPAKVGDTTDVDKNKARIQQLDVKVSGIMELLMGIDFSDMSAMPADMPEFDMDGIQALIEGVIPVKAKISGLLMDETYSGYACETEFEGTITLNADGYVLSVTNGSTAITVNCVVTFDNEGDDVSMEKEYSIEANGTISITKTTPATEETPEKKETKTLTLVANGEDAVVDGDSVYYAFFNTDSYFYAKAGTIDNQGLFVVDSFGRYDEEDYDYDYETVIDEDATFNGDINVIGSALVIEGTFNGDVVASEVYVDLNEKNEVVSTLNGDVVADYIYVGADGVLNGNVVIGTEGIAIWGAAIGDITMTEAGSSFSAAGTVNVSVTYEGEYKATYGESVEPSAFEVKFDVVTDMEEAGDEAAVTLVMMPAKDATETEAGVPGYIAYADIPREVDGDVSVTLTAGAVKFDSSEAFPIGYELVIEKGATLEIAKNMYLDVTTAALKVSLDAVRNYDNDDFGEVRAVMSFDITGYTIYSNIAYALENCEPNSTLELKMDGQIDDDVDVKTGVNFVVKDGLTLTITDVNVTMQDGAKFTIEGTGVIEFVAPDLTDTKDKSISGVFAYDVNTIAFDKVYFYAAASIEGRPATDDAPSMLDIDVNYYGTITVTAGNVTGDIRLDPYMNAEKEISPATLVINEGTAVNNARFTVVPYLPKDPAKDTYYAGTVTVNGTLNVERLTINGIYNGDGQIVIAEDGEIAIQNDAVVDVIIADANGNGYDFVNVKDSTLKLSSVNNAGTYVVTLGDSSAIGQLAAGQIDALKDAYIEKVIIGVFDLQNKSDAAISADVMHIGAGIIAYGLLKTKTAISAEEIENVDYDAIYTDGDYTVYTWFMFIDQTAVTDITVDGTAFSGHVNGYYNPTGVPVAGGDEGDDVAPAAPVNAFVISGINLTVLDKTAIELEMPLVIGTARTTIGAGTVINGLIWVQEGQYVIVYYDADVIADNVKTFDGKENAVFSKFDVDGYDYAVVYSNPGLTLDKPASVMKPTIAGYNFTSWNTYNGEDLEAVEVGETDVTATLVAGKVTVNATAYEGVVYYCDGVEFMSTGMDVQVKVGSVFTAKIIDKDKLEGTPLVNGVESFKVTGEYNVLEISGVTEKKAPSNDDDDDDGLGLTEILLIVLVVLIAVMCVILILRLNRS
jgi:hypothetical protein